jgi:hypothetical protein
MDSKHKPGHLGEAHEPAEHDMRRQPRIDPSKPPPEDDLPSFDWLKALGMIAIAVAFAFGGLKLGGIW